MGCCGLGSAERVSVVLIYGQIGCSLLGSLSPLYNGVLIIHLGVSLFGLVAVESSNQSLARTYAFLLFCSFFLDLSWFFLFAPHIWRFPSHVYGTLASYAVRLTLLVQILGLFLRFLSSFLWIKIYTIGAVPTSFHDSDQDDSAANFFPLFRDRTTTTSPSRYLAIPNGVDGASASAGGADTSSKLRSSDVKDWKYYQEDI